MERYSYNRDNVRTGIVHFGVGNFHRAHQEYYTDKLMSGFPDQLRWGICGAMILPQDERLYRALKSRDNHYTLTECFPDGSTTVRTIGALKELYWGIEERDQLLARLSSPQIALVTLTITEGGYNIDRETGEFCMETPDVAHDLAHPSEPRTVFGYMAEALRCRKEAGLPLTILSCDNLRQNGNTAKKAFLSFFKAQDPELARWAEENVSFPNSMVDRITPATKPADIVRLNALNGTDDPAPVCTEDFIQWVIEDNFICGRPAWERVGVLFTDKVDDYENMKLTLLNASHMMIGFAGTLAGYSKVDEVMADPVLGPYIRTYMERAMTPLVPPPPGIDLNEYKDSLMARFSNPTISDTTARLCGDGISKLKVYIIPPLRKQLQKGMDTTDLAFFTACYYLYLHDAKDCNGKKIDVEEPYMSEEDWQIIRQGKPEIFTTISLFSDCAEYLHPGFNADVARYADLISRQGVIKTIESLL